MRLGFWQLFSTLALLVAGTSFVNPLSVPSQDPRLRLLGIAPFTLAANSMAPALVAGDQIVANAWAYRLGQPQRGDVVVFRHPQMPQITYVKRLIGLPGERVAIRGGTVFIDGKALVEPYVLDRPEDRKPSTAEMAERVVSEGEVFVLGDNRNNSNDSRYWGMVPVGNLVGKAGKFM